MNILIIIEALAMIIVIIGVILIAIPKIEGQYCMFVAQILWIVFGIFNEHYFFLIQSFVLLCINIFAIINWRKKRVGI